MPLNAQPKGMRRGFEGLNDPIWSNRSDLEGRRDGFDGLVVRTIHRDVWLLGDPPKQAFGFNMNLMSCFSRRLRGPMLNLRS